MHASVSSQVADYVVQTPNGSVALILPCASAYFRAVQLANRRETKNGSKAEKGSATMRDEDDAKNNYAGQSVSHYYPQGSMPSVVETETATYGVPGQSARFF